MSIQTEFGQQIEDLLIINLEVGAADQEVLSTVFCIVKESEDMIDRLWNNAFKVLTVSVHARLNTHHRMTLAATGLTVGENGTVVSLDDRLDEPEASLIIHLLLRAFHSVYVVKSELAAFLLLVRLSQSNCLLTFIYFNDAC